LSRLPLKRAAEKVQPKSRKVDAEQCCTVIKLLTTLISKAFLDSKRYEYNL
jgi:hypothetical protein